MRQNSSARGSRRLRVVHVAAVRGDALDRRWRASASLLLVVGAGLASWAAIILSVLSLTG